MSDFLDGAGKSARELLRLPPAERERILAVAAADAASNNLYKDAGGTRGFLDKWIGRVYVGDCLDFMAQLPDGCVDAVITDPPYGVGACRNDEPPDERYVAEMCRVSRGPVVMFGGAPIRSQRHFLGLNPDRCLVWSPSCQLGQPSSNSMFWCWHPIWCWRLPKKQEEIARDVLRCPTDRRHHSVDHEAAKPVRLMAQLVRAFTPPLGVVFDPYIGSGTTAIAAEAHRRKWLACEIDAPMWAKAENRIRGERANLRLPMEEPQQAVQATLL